MVYYVQTPGDRFGDHHDGVCAYVNTDLYSRRRLDLELQHMEGIWIEGST